MLHGDEAELAGSPFLPGDLFDGRALLGRPAEAVGRLLDELFGRLRPHRVTAFCDVENGASVRLLERLGMRREGHFVENIWLKGSWGSEYLYAVLRREWPAGR